MNTFLLFIKVSLKLFFLRYFPTPVLGARCTGKTWSANKSLGWWSSVDINTIYRDGAENIAMMNFCVCSCLASTRGKHRAAVAPYFLNMFFSSFVGLLNCDLCNNLLLVRKKTSVEFNISTNIITWNVIDMLLTQTSILRCGFSFACMPSLEI